MTERRYIWCLAGTQVLWLPLWTSPVGPVLKNSAPTSFRTYTFVPPSHFPILNWATYCAADLESSHVTSSHHRGPFIDQALPAVIRECHSLILSLRVFNQILKLCVHQNYLVRCSKNNWVLLQCLDQWLSAMGEKVETTQECAHLFGCHHFCSLWRKSLNCFKMLTNTFSTSPRRASSQSENMSMPTWYFNKTFLLHYPTH